MPTQEVTSCRKDFPMLNKTMHGKPLIYFDTAATAQKPQCVIDAMTRFYQKDYATVHRAIYDLATNATALYQETRQKAQRFINAKESCEIIYTSGATGALNLIANSFGRAFVEPGDEILVSAIAHHANILPWQMLCEQQGAALRVIPVNDAGELDLQSFKNMLSEKTKLVAVGHISNAIGTVNPIKEITTLAHAVGAKVSVDGAQAAPHLPIDVQELGVDFYTFSGHKVYGPTGIGILYGKEELLNAMPPYQSGGDMIERVTFENTTYNTLPTKFEAGTPNIAGVIGLGAALDYLQAIGLPTIHAWEQQLLNYATTQIQAIDDLQIIGTAREKGALISFIIPGIHHLDLGTLLDLEGIALRTGHLCAQPTMKRFGIEGTARISFGLYNTFEEIDRFIASLQKVVRQLRG